jgi:hypothetical protein
MSCLRLRVDSCGARVPSVFRPRAPRIGRAGSVWEPLGLEFAGQRSVSHCVLTFLSGGPCDRGNPCPQCPAVGEGGDAGGQGARRGGSSIGAAGCHGRNASRRRPGRADVFWTGRADRFSGHPDASRAVMHQLAAAPHRRILQWGHRQGTPPTDTARTPDLRAGGGFGSRPPARRSGQQRWWRSAATTQSNQV